MLEIQLDTNSKLLPDVSSSGDKQLMLASFPTSSEIVEMSGHNPWYEEPPPRPLPYLFRLWLSLTPDDKIRRGSKRVNATLISLIFY